MHEIAELDSRGLRNFGLTTGAIVVGLFGMLLPWLLSHQWSLWPWILAAALWIPALLFPKFLKPIYWGWMKFGAVLGFINKRIILGLFFFVVMAPFGVIMRLFGYDPLRRRSEAQATYRVPSKNQPTKNMEKPY
jgi:hypothetical protein